MNKAVLFAALLTAGVSFHSPAQAPEPVTTPTSAPTVAMTQVRVPTVLALATPAPAPLPALAELAAPLPAGQTVQPLRPNDGLQTTHLILGIAAAAVALVGAIIALKR